MRCRYMNTVQGAAVAYMSQKRSDKYTIFSVTEKKPKGARYIIVDGVKYEMIPVCESKPFYAVNVKSTRVCIRGKIDLEGKEVSFA